MANDDENSDGFERDDTREEYALNDFVRQKVKFEIYGEQMIEKTVNSSGNSGRVYLPPEWIGTKVKVIKC